MRRAAIVANPSKLAGDAAQVRGELTSVFVKSGWTEPLWLETTEADPGTGQGRLALAEGVDLVAALGGDGTVRGVADALVGSTTPLAIVPAGTGNLLARNLRIRKRGYAATLRSALDGRTQVIDTMAVELDRDGDGHFDPPTTGTVMTGIGLDADIINSTNESLKTKVGWLAYPLAGGPHLRHSLYDMTVTYDDEPPAPPRGLTSVLVGNCGRLTGGVRLMPDAVIDDGELDTVELRADGVLGWVPLVTQVLSGSLTRTQAVRHRRSRSVVVSSDRPAMVEIDGDVPGKAHAIRVTIRPKSLYVRVQR